MKVKTIVGLMACAVFVPAFADTTPIDNSKPTTNNWFSTKVESSAVSVTNATWGATSTPTVESGASAMVIDADVNSPATLTPSDATADGNASDGLVTIASKAYLAPSAKADLPTAAVLINAQVGFAVATETVGETTTTNFYAYVRQTPTTVNSETVQNGEWIALTGVNPPANEADTEFKIDIDYQNKKVSFSVKANGAYVVLSGTPSGAEASTTSFGFVPVDDTTAWLSEVAAIGSGTITSIDATYENAVAVVDNVRYGTIAEAYTAAGSSGTVAVWDPSTGGAAAVQTAANGLTLAECKALNIEPTATIALTPAAHTAENIVLQTAIAPVAGVSVTFAVGTTAELATGSYPANAIEIPLTQGTYVVKPSVSAGTGN